MKKKKEGKQIRKNHKKPRKKKKRKRRRKISKPRNIQKKTPTTYHLPPTPLGSSITYDLLPIPRERFDNINILQGGGGPE